MEKTDYSTQPIYQMEIDEPIQKSPLSSTETVFNLSLKPKEMERKEVHQQQIPTWPYGTQQLPTKQQDFVEEMETSLHKPELLQDVEMLDVSHQKTIPEKTVQVNFEKLEIAKQRARDFEANIDVFGGGSGKGIYIPSAHDNIIMSFKRVENGKTYIFITRQENGQTLGHINFDI